MKIVSGEMLKVFKALVDFSLNDCSKLKLIFKKNELRATNVSLFFMIIAKFTARIFSFFKLNEDSSFHTFSCITV